MKISLEKAYLAYQNSAADGELAEALGFSFFDATDEDDVFAVLVAVFLLQHTYVNNRSYAMEWTNFWNDLPRSAGYGIYQRSP